MSDLENLRERLAHIRQFPIAGRDTPDMVLNKIILGAALNLDIAAMLLGKPRVRVKMGRQLVGMIPSLLHPNRIPRPPSREQNLETLRKWWAHSGAKDYKLDYLRDFVRSEKGK